MVTKTCEPEVSGCRFELRCNQSLSPQGRRLFFGAMVLVSFAIAGWFLLLGAWMVFPFAGLEMLVLGTVLLLIGRREDEWERLEVMPERLRVSRWQDGVASSWTFQRHWVRVSLERPLYRGHAQRLMVGSHGRRIEIAALLADEERVQLFEALRRSMMGADRKEFQPGA